MTPAPTKLQIALGQALRARRAELGISQEEVSAKSGLARSFLSAAETAKASISLRSAERLAAALELSLSELIARAERLIG